MSRANHAPVSRFRLSSCALLELVGPRPRRIRQTSDASVIGSPGKLAPTSTTDQARFPRRPVKVDALSRTETPSVDEEGLHPFQDRRLKSRRSVLDAASPIAVSRARLDRLPRLQPQPETFPTVRHRLPTSATRHEGRARPANDHSSNGPRLARCPLPGRQVAPMPEPRAAEFRSRSSVVG